MSWKFFVEGKGLDEIPNTMNLQILLKKTENFTFKSKQPFEDYIIEL
jgi:hypothetical protein